MKKLSYLILTATIIFNLWLNFPETQILADPNDNIFQYSLVGRTNWVWENYGCPFSLSCLPNLIDHNVPNWAEGYPLPFYYSHVPQITIVSSYHLIIQPITKIFQPKADPAKRDNFSLYQYYNLTRYLLLSLFPLSVFLALRIVGFSPIIAALATFFAANFSTDGLYGIDPPSYLWRGYGLTSQLYGLFFLPLGIAFVYKALRNGNSKLETRISDLFLATIFLTLTTAGHLGIGIIGILSTIPFLFFDLNPKHIFKRVKTLFFVICYLLYVLSYWLIPILLNNNYHIISFWDPIWKFNSYGWYEVAKQFFSGEIFDWQRFPIISILVVIGFLVMSLGKKTFVFSLLFAFWFLMYFGRTTWGGLIDLIPGMKDFHQHRFIVGIHIAALFLIPAGLNYLFDLLRKIIGITYHIIEEKGRLARRSLSEGGTRKFESYTNIISYIFIFTFVSILVYFTAKQTVSYATLNNKWIYQANNAYRYDEKNFKELLTSIDRQPKGRIYAGRPGNWGKDFRLGSTQLYLLFGGIGYDISQFLPETWSPLSENEQNFDEREAIDYDLLNISSVVAPKNEGFSDKVKLTQKFGPFELYQAPTSGWFDIVTAPMFVKSDKTNYINLVHFWWNSYPRRWKMHPLISVENNPKIPEGMQKVIGMKDEVSYIEDTNAPLPPLRLRGGEGGVKNIFSDYPFVFPEATISAYLKDNDKDTPGVAGIQGFPRGGGAKNNVAIISNEKVYEQTYSATIDVPDNCKQCMIMFKMSYHPNWTAKLDGQTIQKFAVFPFYLAIPASPGLHQVEFSYEPNRLKIYLIIFEAIIILIFLFRKRLVIIQFLPVKPQNHPTGVPHTRGVKGSKLTRREELNNYKN